MREFRMNKNKKIGSTSLSTIAGYNTNKRPKPASTEAPEAPKVAKTAVAKPAFEVTPIFDKTDEPQLSVSEALSAVIIRGDENEKSRICDDVDDGDERGISEEIINEPQSSSIGDTTGDDREDRANGDTDTEDFSTELSAGVGGDTRDVAESHDNTTSGDKELRPEQPHDKDTTKATNTKITSTKRKKKVSKEKGETRGTSTKTKKSE